MFSFLKNLFTSERPNITEIVQQGALILDVRTPSEFSSGYIKGAVNIPLNLLSSSLDQIPDKDQPIITCCASGMRSASAKKLLIREGYSNVINGGGWQSLKSQLG